MAVVIAEVADVHSHIVQFIRVQQLSSELTVAISIPFTIHILFRVGSLSTAPQNVKVSLKPEGFPGFRRVPTALIGEYAATLLISPRVLLSLKLHFFVLSCSNR